MEELNRLSVRELRQRCAVAGISTEQMMEKHELAGALHAAVKEAEAAAELEEAEAMRQAMLMSEESSESLAALSVGELRSRCAARDIETRGFSEKQELIAALLCEGDPASEQPAVATAAEPPSLERLESTGAAVVGRFAESFHVRAADETMLDPSGGKVSTLRACAQAP